MTNLDEISQKLLTHPYFEKAKKVKEIGIGHPEESVYAHLVETASQVKRHRKGEFIQNKEARQLYLDFMNRKIEGIVYSDIAYLTGFLHDIGKILSFKEEGKVYPINTLQPDGKSSQSPNHGYYGSIIVKPLLIEFGLSHSLTHYISEIIRLHLVPFDYYNKVLNYPITDAINDLKPRMEGLHIEVLINAYADISNNPPLQNCRELIEKIFNEPHFYSQRKYFVE